MTRKKEAKKIVEFKDVVKQYGQGEGAQLANNHVNFTKQKEIKTMKL